MLNGMPPVGRAFTDDLAAWVLEFDPEMTRCVQDEYIFVFIRSPHEYLKMAFIVDDFIISYKSRELLEEFDLHMEKKWTLKKMDGLQGFLNNSYTHNLDFNTVTITMEARLAEMMLEHLPHSMDAKTFPDTPNHPNISKIEECTVAISDEKARMMHRLVAQLIYVVVNNYYNGQFAAFRCGRIVSRPNALYAECAEYALHHLYGTRHIGLTLGGVGPSQLAVSAWRPSEDEKPIDPLLIAHYVDAGMAEGGPSTGGFTVDAGTVTLHAASGTHAATTIGTTDSETYELSRCVATAIGARDLATELGVPQLEPSPIRCDNSGSVRKAASAASDKRSPYMRRRVKFIEEAQARKVHPRHPRPRDGEPRGHPHEASRREALQDPPRRHSQRESCRSSHARSHREGNAVPNLGQLIPPSRSSRYTTSARAFVA